MLAYFKNRAANFNQGKVNVREENGKASCLTSSMASCDISDNFIETIMDFIKTDRDKSICLDANYYKGIGEVNGTWRTTVSNQKQSLIQIGNIYNNDHNSVAGRVYTDKGKSVTLSALGGGGGAKTGLYQTNKQIRRLTPNECERLQTVPDGYTSCVSDTQRYRMLGNGWTVDVIAYIFSYLDFKIPK
jgi:site-specific DNA-cytosine methylase